MKYMNYMKVKILFNIIVFSCLPAFSQTNFMPAELIAEPGEQKSNNLTSGTSASLRVSTSSSFGTNVSASTSGRFTTNATSNLKTKTEVLGDQVSRAGTYTSTFGGNSIGDINVEVSNIRSTGSGTHSGVGSEEGDIFNINSDEALAAEGKASVKGVFNNLEINIDGENTTNNAEIEDLKAVKDPITGESINIDSEDREENPIDTANSSSGVRMDSSLNVDISNNDFNNAFSQAF